LRPPFKHSGFTLVEVTLSILFLGIMVMGVSGLYFTAQRSLLDQEHLLPLDSRLRGRMEEIVSRPFAAIAGGSEAITIDGKNYTVTWSVTQPDLDGDAVAEPTAKQITVTVDGRSLTTLVIDNQGNIGKI
jgi:Tfp pilus assembly protein PilV